MSLLLVYSCNFFENTDENGMPLGNSGRFNLLKDILEMDTFVQSLVKPTFRDCRTGCGRGHTGRNKGKQSRTEHC